MYKNHFRLNLYHYVLMTLILNSGAIWAFDVDSHKLSGDLEIYLGLLPTEVIQNIKIAQENNMHGGIPEGKDKYHLVVALFDKRTGERISVAQVTANISSFGMDGSTKALEIMKINDVVTFGNYYKLSKNMSYRIRLKIDVPSKGTTEVVFKASGATEWM